MSRVLILASILMFVAACAKRSDLSDNQTLIQQVEISGNGKMKYATGFTLKESDSSVFIQVNNPWKKKEVLASYLLIKLGDKKRFKSKADFVISVPVKDIAVMSSVCIGMIKLLEEENTIMASGNARLIYDSVVYNKYLAGDLIDLGESPEMNTELVVGASPDLLMKYIYGNRDINDLKVTGAGIPIAYILEFMEPHPLGRAEWLKFVAAFLDKDEMADSIFSTIEKEYLRYKDKASRIVKKPTVLDGSGYKGTWYAAGGKSFPAHLYADAGADYFWKNDSSQGSIPLSFEVILDKQANADYWLGPSSGNRRELIDIESRYSLLKSFRNGNVFYFGKRKNPNGGLDYYESGVVRPDILLKDLLWVFHPELLGSSYQPVYLERIKE